MSFLQENNSFRSKSFPARGKALPLPIYFPSISSLKAGLSPFDYYRILNALGQEHFLVSAFDIENSPHRADFIKELKANQEKNGSIILMDSGNYETYWMRDKNWDLNSFNKILKEDICDLAFCYDNQFPTNVPKENASWIKESLQKSQSVTTKASVIPIVHCKKESLNETVIELYNQNNFTMVAVPERILGDGILERVVTVTNLRKELNKLENYIYIHLLGTGNPFSLLLFSLAGADSFDGLEWCQTVVNSTTGLLYHFQQRDLILDDCTFCKTHDLDYALSSLGHNLSFYNNWMKKIQEAIGTNSTDNLVKEFFNSAVINTLNKLWN